MVFKRTPDGKKTVRMFQAEAHLGRTLEEDYDDYYVTRGWGQKRLAGRWGVKRALVFELSPRSRRRRWVETLGLPVRRELDDHQVPAAPPPPACEACSESSVPLERAHWWEAKDGGPALAFNIFLLCPNCHT